ncbi:Pick C1-like protein 1 [Seminavis robusta]|uniref:Pick C1-like protein 1 n=1 Tax=Seminavis robusta TaxID=568900 RepID=A0A9N8DP60_9STRA|nr:Pick C1-like protein 1 [Seminavis robusta]|eukprot:Sro255_g100470.1 Pick C1-like protein 1 (1380) ;mRNA; f:68783-73169
MSATISTLQSESDFPVEMSTRSSSDLPTSTPSYTRASSSTQRSSSIRINTRSSSTQYSDHNYTKDKYGESLTEDDQVEIEVLEALNEEEGEEDTTVLKIEQDDDEDDNDIPEQTTDDLEETVSELRDDDDDDDDKVPAARKRSLLDNSSPTSVFSGDSEVPYDEKADLSRIQFVSSSANSSSSSSSGSNGSSSSGSSGSSTSSTSSGTQKNRLWNFFRRDKNASSSKKKGYTNYRNRHAKLEEYGDSSEAVPSRTFESASTDLSRTSKSKRSNKRFLCCCCQYWTWFTEDVLHAAIRRMVVSLSTSAARNPFRWIGGLTFVSLAVLATGFFTNFQLIVDSDEIFTPINSLPTKHSDWLVHDSGFQTIRPVLMVIHNHGSNVLGKEPITKLFEAIDVVRNTPGYDDICSHGTYMTHDGINTCRIFSATRFWNHNKTLFDLEVQTDENVTDIMSASTYQDGSTPVFHEMILGNYEMSNTSLVFSSDTGSFATVNHSQRLHFVQSYVVRMELPDAGEEADDFETRALQNLKLLKESWEEDETNQLQLDFLSIYAYKIENQRAMIRDLPLVTGIFLVLVIFTTLVFSKRHPVYSRGMLGCGSLLAIGMSLAMSYGIVWCIGVPFTNIAQILPFMIMGVGLDDTFIITGSYFRTNPNHSVERRIETTMNEVGTSITLTSITTSVAFILGSFSSIPGVKWLCWYAFSAIVVDYFFQLTYFVAILSLDERRLQAYRRNWCCWRTVPVDIDDCESQMGVIISSSVDSSSSRSSSRGRGRRNNDDEEETFQDESRYASGLSRSYETGKHSHFSERFMVWYGNQLMRPWVKLLVILVFATYFGFCGYRATLLKQEFNVEDYTPADSYLRGTLYSLDQYYSLTKPLEVYFRDVDQSDPEMQQQMRDYVDELAALPQIGEEAPFCWVRDFDQIAERFPQYAFIEEMDLPFNQKMSLALSNPTIREIYGEDIVVDEETGDIIASRCLLFLRNLDLTIVKDQIAMLKGQRQVSREQPINSGLEDLKFFSFDPIFFYWELYAEAVDELLFTIVSGVIAVTFVSFVLIPHWSAIFFVCPGIIVLYVNFLGTMQLMGLDINSLTYVIICMAIGLLVDFLVHILLRYYETDGDTREDKVKDTLRTMGASMFVGGLTTFLGVCPLVLSTTHIFMTVFWAFLAMVVLGFTHGLILLPVVLSLMGPLSSCHRNDASRRDIPGKKKGSSSSALSSTSSSTSSAAYKYDDEILASSSEEELEELTAEEKEELEKVATQVRTVPFLGPSYELEMIEEGPGSRPTSTSSAKSGKSLRSIVEAPSDEIALASPRAVSAAAKAAVSASLLGKLADAYNCTFELGEFDFYETVTNKACKPRQQSSRTPNPPTSPVATGRAKKVEFSE